MNPGFTKAQVTYILPKECCVCLGPAETSMMVRSENPLASPGDVIARELEIPLCRGCGKRNKRRLAALFFTPLVAGIVASAALRSLAPLMGGVAVMFLIMVLILTTGWLSPAHLTARGPRFRNQEYQRRFESANRSA